ncbi:MAG: cytidyltransferase [Acidimicrobiales bacterium]|nr:MAG: cytidyltransferase [Acidimicrobiales bacterium]
MPTVLVSGCFDLLHPGHVAFLRDAATYGDLHVRIGTDANVALLKGKAPMFTQDERLYMLRNLTCVHAAEVAGGTGVLDFEPDLATLQPDTFVVNHDGHTAAKETLCVSTGVEYVVLDRIPPEDYPARSSTAVKDQLGLPYRLCLAGGWLDQPWVSSLAPGPVVVAQIEPAPGLAERSGLATSTRQIATDLWHDKRPVGDPAHLARMLFALENPPGSTYISGSQDALGLMLPGANRLHYKGDYWPETIDSAAGPETAEWLSSVLHLAPLSERPDGYDPLAEQHLSSASARRLADAGEAAWQGIVQKNLSLLGHGLNETVEAWQELLPLTVPRTAAELRSRYAEHPGSVFSGAGGGYLIVASETDVPGSFQVTVTSDVL